MPKGFCQPSRLSSKPHNPPPKGNKRQAYDVRCWNCGRVQQDDGIRQTCVRCGAFPLPSYSYDQDSSFHPKNCHGVAGTTGSPDQGPPSVKRRPWGTAKPKPPELPRVTEKPSIIKVIKDLPRKERRPQVAKVVQQPKTPKTKTKKAARTVKSAKRKTLFKKRKY